MLGIIDNTSELFIGFNSDYQDHSLFHLDVNVSGQIANPFSNLEESFKLLEEYKNELYSLGITAASVHNFNLYQDYENSELYNIHFKIRIDGSFNELIEPFKNLIDFYNAELIQHNSLNDEIHILPHPIKPR